ncbi:MAG: hypothetical protein DI636_11720, partial [Pelagerythrobacter marensis]
MTRFATLRQTDTAAPFAALGPRLAAPEAAAPDRLGVYLETLQILDRLHRLMLDLVKDEFERLGQTDLTPVQALLIYNLGEYQGSNVSYNLKKLVQMGYVHHQRSDMDRRSVRVRLTPQGEAVRGMIYRMFARHAAGLAASGVLDDPPLEQVNPQLR